MLNENFNSLEEAVEEFENYISAAIEAENAKGIEYFIRYF